MTDAPKAKPVAPKDIKYAKAPLTAFGHYVCGEVDSMMMGSTRPASFSAHLKVSKLPQTAVMRAHCCRGPSWCMARTTAPVVVPAPRASLATLLSRAPQDAWKPDYDQLPDASKGAFDALAANAAEERRRKHEEQLARFAPGTQQQAPTGALDT